MDMDNYNGTKVDTMHAEMVDTTNESRSDQYDNSDNQLNPIGSIPRKRTRSNSSTSSDQRKAIAGSISDDAVISRLTNDSTSQLLTDSFSMMESRVIFIDENIENYDYSKGDKHLIDQCIHEVINGTIVQTEDDYPLVLEPEHANTTADNICVTKSIYDHTENMDTDTLNGPVSSAFNNQPTTFSVIRGPTFKMTGTKPAIWTPCGGERVTEESSKDVSSSILSPISYNSKLTISPIPFTNGTTDISPISSIGWSFSPDKAQPVDSVSSKQREISNHVAHGVSTRVACVTRTEPDVVSEDINVIDDQNRSIVEYPEKRSVATLRSAIESKLNGTPPIKAIPSSPIFGNVWRDSDKHKTALIKGEMNVKMNIAVPSERPKPTQRARVSLNAPSESNGSASIGGSSAFDTRQICPLETIDTYKSASPAKEKSEATSIIQENSASVPLYSSRHGAPIVDQEPNIDYGLSDIIKNSELKYSTPLSVSTNMHDYRTATPPRPPLPSDSNSPLPSIPPPIDFSTQYSPASTTSTVTTLRTVDTKDSTYQRNYRRNDETHGDSVSTSPLKSFVRNDTQRFVEAKVAPMENYYAHINPKTPVPVFGRDKFGKHNDSGLTTSSTLRRHAPNADYQHHWYKMMYRKLHRVPLKDDLNPYTVKYKLLPHSQDARNADEPTRPVRSKSVGRYESSTPPPSVPAQPQSTDHSQISLGLVRSSIPGENYRLQPRSIENYTPGTSSALDYEQEKQRIQVLSNRPKTAVPFASHYNQEQSVALNLGFENNGHCTSDQKRRDLSPLSKEESKYWYQNVQTGGDVPLTGFRHPAPERAGSPQLHSRSDTPTRIRSTGERLNQNCDEISKLEKELILEEERKKKQEKEIQDQKARRHGYIPPTKSVASVGDQRFAKLINDYSQITARKSITPTSLLPVPSQAKGYFARVLYNFVAQTPREVSVHKGDTVKIRRQLDENWYEGEVNGRVGILPVHYVDVPLCLPDHEPKTDPMRMDVRSENQARVLFSYDARSSHELSLSKGEIVNVTKRIDDYWCEGENSSGRRGIFPANYVQDIKTSDFANAFGTAPSSRMCSKSEDSLSKLLINGVLYDNKTGAPVIDARPEIATCHMAKTDVPSLQNNLTCTTGDAVLTKYEWPSKKEVASNGTEALGAVLSSGQAETFQALFAYKPQNPDELELKEHDIIYVVEKCDDGWYIGTSVRTGKFGTFPGNYVKSLSSKK